MAREMGFSAAGFLMPEDFDWPDVAFLTRSPWELLPGASCVIILIMPYALNIGLDDDIVPYSAYYVASHAAHAKRKEIIEGLQLAGHQAVSGSRLPNKAAALRFGLTIGKNSLIQHGGEPCLIQLIVTDAFAPEQYPAGGVCADCGACVRACPVNALDGGFRRERCIRHHMDNHFIPLDMRPHMKTLIGCDICTAACPASQVFKAPSIEEQHAFSYERLLSGQMPIELVGRNFARPKRLIVQTLILCANYGKTQYLPLIERYCSEDGPVGEIALWAIEKLRDM